MEFFNSYEDKIRAEAYSKLEFHKTYYLVYRDLPNIIEEHVKGKKALDFGCGTGKSTRFLTFGQARNPQTLVCGMNRMDKRI